MRLPAAVAAVLAAILLAACGSSGGSGASTTSSAASAPTTGASSTAPATSTSTTTTATSTSTATTTTAAGPSPCIAADLALSFLGQQGATGHGLLGFALRNSSSHPCHTFGYPGIQWLDKTGAPLPTTPQRTTHDFFGSAPESRLLIDPAANVSFRLGVLHGTVPGAKCAMAYGLQVIPPDDTHTLHVAIPGGAYECTTTTVSPVRPGNSAYP